jgi:hypothetical protein
MLTPKAQDDICFVCQIVSQIKRHPSHRFTMIHTELQHLLRLHQADSLPFSTILYQLLKKRQMDGILSIAIVIFTVVPHLDYHVQTKANTRNEQWLPHQPLISI